MENHDAPFAIEETFGELLTTDFLDRETVAFYTLTVIGMDMHPTQPLSSSVLVTVLVGDINDHWPQFLDSPFVAYVPAEFSPGEMLCFLVTVKVTLLKLRTKFTYFVGIFPQAQLFVQ